MSDREPRHQPETPPLAEIAPRRHSWLWTIPAISMVVVGWLIYSAWSMRGVTVSVRFTDGHGLKAGDPVRYRGIDVGEVTEVKLTSKKDGIDAILRFSETGSNLARANSRFWIVRPELGLHRVSGLETLIGPRYVAVLPGPTDRARQRTFDGLAEPPVVPERDPKDLEVILESRERSGIEPGAPVTYREIRVGTVLSVGLTSDGSGVEARLHIRRAYRELIRERTVFWPSGGLDADVGIQGISVKIQSLPQLLLGGIALATPSSDRAGEAVHTGHRYVLSASPPESWDRWTPAVAIGNDLLPVGCPLPTPLRASLTWEQGVLFSGTRTRAGWLLRTTQGLMGPADLASAPDKAKEGTAFLEVAGNRQPVSALTDEQSLIVLPIELRSEATVWPNARIRPPEQPEDSIVVADPSAGPIPLAASRLTVSDGRFLVDESVSVDPRWHGACVLARSDGSLIGFLSVQNESTTILPIRERP